MVYPKPTWQDFLYHFDTICAGKKIWSNLGNDEISRPIGINLTVRSKFQIVAFYRHFFKPVQWSQFLLQRLYFGIHVVVLIFSGSSPAPAPSAAVDPEPCGRAAPCSQDSLGYNNVQVILCMDKKERWNYSVKMHRYSERE